MVSGEGFEMFSYRWAGSKQLGAVRFSALVLFLRHWSTHGRGCVAMCRQREMEDEASIVSESQGVTAGQGEQRLSSGDRL